jgi:hypothetical protein
MNLKAQQGIGSEKIKPFQPTHRPFSKTPLPHNPVLYALVH